MIDASSKTTVKSTTRRRSTRRVLKEESGNGDLSNGSSYHVEDDSDFDRSWNYMNYSDYVDYRRRKDGSLDNSRVSNSSTYEEGSKTPGFIFRYYKQFGFYWNIFPKTDYCYLPGSPDYQKEISPGIPKVPNLSRYPLQSYIQRGIKSSSAKSRTSHEAESRTSFHEKPLMSSSRYETSQLLLSSESSKRDWHESINSRKSLLNHNSSHRSQESSSSWRRVKSLSKTILTVIKRTTVTTVTTITHITGSLVSTHPDGSRSCNWLPLFLFLLLLPLAYYIFPGVLGAKQNEIVTAVSSPASDFLSWSVGRLYSALYLVKESLLYIPTIWSQLAALFMYNSSSVKAESGCTDLPANVIQPPLFPLVDMSPNLTEEKLLLLQTEIVNKLKSEMTGQNHHITAWIEQIQKQLTNLTEEMKKMSNQFEGDQKQHFHKLEGELSDLRRAVIDVRDQAAVGSIASPSDRMVERAVAKYHADRTGKPDYALQSSGGYIVRVRCTQTYTKTTGNFYLFGLPLPWDVFNGPETIIKPGVMPGECWAFEGSFAQVTLHLATPVKVTSFSLEHSPKELALLGHISSAPKQFSVWALKNENDDNPTFLGRFTFLDNGESLQQFDSIAHDQTVELIELKIESNHGHPEYTCLYRFRVHGVPSTFFEAGGNNTRASQTSSSLDSTSKPHSKPYR